MKFEFFFYVNKKMKSPNTYLFVDFLIKTKR